MTVVIREGGVRYLRFVARRFVFALLFCGLTAFCLAAVYGVGSFVAYALHGMMGDQLTVAGMAVIIFGVVFMSFVSAYLGDWLRDATRTFRVVTARLSL